MEFIERRYRTRQSPTGVGDVDGSGDAGAAEEQLEVTLSRAVLIRYTHLCDMAGLRD